MHDRKVQHTENHGKRRCFSGRIFTFVLMGIAALMGMALVFWLLWNMVAARLLAFPSLTYVQSLGAVLLTGLLVRMGRHMSGRNGHRRFKRADAGCNRPFLCRKNQASSA